MFNSLRELFAKCATDNRPVPSAAVRVRPSLDVLEDRTVPSTVVVDFPGQGLFRYDTIWQNWQLINGQDPTAMSVDSTTGDVVASFSGVGTALWTPCTGWSMLTGAEAQLLSMSGSDQNIVGEFPGWGVWEFHPTTGWMNLTRCDAYDLVTDAAGNVAGEFSGYGVWYYNAKCNTWGQLTPVDASQVVMADVGYVVGEFPNAGVWANYAGGGWWQMNSADAISLAGAGTGGLVAASFAGAGTYSYYIYSEACDPWYQITPCTADTVVTDGSDFACEFQGCGAWLYDAASAQWVAVGADVSGVGVGVY
jgi:hypothetical protein